MKLERKRVISIDVSIGKYEEFIENILWLAEERVSSYVCIANVHMTVEAYRNKNFAYKVNNANIVTPDGMPIVYALRMLYGIKQDRVAGMDLLPDLIREAEERSLSVFFYGSTEPVLDAISKKLKRDHPHLRIGGMFSPPFRKLNNAEKEEIAAMINNSGANMVFVSLGCPNQEKFMSEMKDKINAVMLGVGAAFPVYAGLKKRAPRWMQKLALEWLFRLMQEPRRLMKRYAYTNTYFVYLLMRDINRRYKDINKKQSEGPCDDL